MNVLEKILQDIEEHEDNYNKLGTLKLCPLWVKEIIKRNLKSGEDNKVLAGDWVPCSVRMPDKYGDYRITVMQKSENKDPEYHTDFAYFNGDTWNTLNDWDEGQETEIIAWKKINDEPYKPAPESADGKRQREREEFFTEYKEQSDQTELNGFLKKRFMEVV